MARTPSRGPVARGAAARRTRARGAAGLQRAHPHPPPHRVAPAQAAAALAALPLRTLELPGAEHLALPALLAKEGIGGGAIYDALVGATAKHHGMRLLTRDRRARPTYDALGIDYELL